MNERIKELRKALKLTQTEFGDKLGITHSAIAHFEHGTVNMSPSTIKSICREFNVNEEWLLNGTGEMFKELSTVELVARIVGQAINTNDEFILKTFIALGQLSPAEWDKIKEFVDKLKEE